MNAQEHLLTCLSEECAEVIQCVSKSLRFGLDDRNVLDPTGPTNRERLMGELADLRAVIGMLVARGIISEKWQDGERLDAKVDKVVKFMNYARSVGALEGKPQ